MMGKRLAVALLAAAAWTAAAPGATPDPRADANRMVEAVVAKMTTDEKIAQLVNVAPAIPRLGIPAYNWWTESLHGALGAVPTTNFPEPIGLGASFDAPMVHDVAAAISTEVRALHTLGRQTGHLGKIGTGLDTWSPNINIFRDPRWGRGQETYGEDPFLTATMGVSFIRGIQGPNPDLPDVIATPKHFAVHSGPESTRHTADVFVSPHDLEDTYMPAFRAAIVEGRANSIMCAYNRVDGQPACGSQILLKDHLRGAWGFQGYVVSDCDAVVDISDRHKYAPTGAAGVAVALKAGVDNECNTATIGGATDLGTRYQQALDQSLISTADLDRALVRLFSARYRNGDLPGLPGRTPQTVPVSAIDTLVHRALALRAATESMVLLKNDGVLPLRRGVRVALVGPLADATRVLRGNYSSPASAPPISVLDGLRQVMPGAQVTLVPFTPSITDGDPVPASAFVTPDGAPGLNVAYYNGHKGAGENATPTYDANPVLERTEPGFTSDADTLKQVADQHKTVWTGFLVAPETGDYRVAITGGDGRLTVPGQPAVETHGHSVWGERPVLVDVHLTKGERYPLRLERGIGDGGASGLVWKRVTHDLDREMKAAAANADVVVAVVGLTSDLEGEEMPLKIEGFAGGDRTSIDLPADQQALLEKAAALGKPLVVVTMNGSAVNLSWPKDHAAAILEAWYPGEAGGRAVADVLTGAADPGGRLPLTFYRSLADLPPFDDYAMKGRTYRYYAGSPVYPFGYGLSYTRFSYAPLKLQPAAEGVSGGLRVSTEVRNIGDRAGDDVAQLYLTFPDVPGVPRLALRGFQRVHLAPGEHRALTFDLSPRDLSAVTADGVREVMAGRFTVSVGSGQPGFTSASASKQFTNDRIVQQPE